MLSGRSVVLVLISLPNSTDLSKPVLMGLHKRRYWYYTQIPRPSRWVQLAAILSMELPCLSLLSGGNIFRNLHYIGGGDESGCGMPVRRWFKKWVLEPPPLNFTGRPPYSLHPILLAHTLNMQNTHPNRTNCMHTWVLVFIQSQLYANVHHRVLRGRFWLVFGPS